MYSEKAKETSVRDIIWVDVIGRLDEEGFLVEMIDQDVKVV